MKYIIIYITDKLFKIFLKLFKNYKNLMIRNFRTTSTQLMHSCVKMNVFEKYNLKIQAVFIEKNKNPNVMHSKNVEQM